MAASGTSGSKAQVFHGARAKVYIEGALVGIFQDVTYSYDLQTEPAYILGRFSPSEIGYVAAAPVRIQATGWRVIGKGPHTTVGGKKLVPTLDELLNHEDMTFVLHDRQNAGNNNERVQTVIGVRPEGYHGGVSNRQLSSMTLPFVGLRISDESGPNDESADASTLDIG
ncbi:MAG: hypothetical protein KGI08_11430 [Thaumarchaeota archaeon]|nr:hypothetical protein [Nitrososphaerota archaeon]